jgi:hypothetical protein
MRHRDVCCKMHDWRKASAFATLTSTLMFLTIPVLL